MNVVDGAIEQEGEKDGERASESEPIRLDLFHHQSRNATRNQTSKKGNRVTYVIRGVSLSFGAFRASVTLAYNQALNRSQKNSVDGIRKSEKG